jgi:hypothetical protein
MAEIWGAAIAAGGAILGGVMSSQGAQSAANTEAGAANAATQAQLQMYNQNVQRLSPWVNAGSSALGTLQGLLPSLTAPFSASQYQESPGYKWELGQGLQAITNSASATGGINSGNTLKALLTYGQGLANQDYQQAFQNYLNQNNSIYNMLSGLSNTGANSAGMTAGLGANTATQIGNNMMGAGNAIAAGKVAGANAIGNSLSSLGNLGLMMQMNGGFGGGGGGGMTNIPSSAYMPDFTQNFAPSGITGA